ncbi:M15 family metallopeptidase [Clostridium gasigenes]|uniref:M15 family metallopeptidase n=1 Tax=Clostridium gasigenes TaxID=94869 RepID=UPI001C0B2C4A|nr:M15 family metallopeptidase [Clostridium gasigenes]MBU3135230.1 M15 family metallopeptidase [Clostridium gasigenes]
MKKNKLLQLLVVGCITLLTFNGCMNNKNNVENIDNSNEPSEDIEKGESNVEYNPMLMMVNDKHWLDESFVPANLEKVNIPFSGASSDEEMHMEYEGAKAVEKLIDGALKDGIALYGISGYRSYQLQQNIYDINVANNGQEYTNNYVAIPGRSEHQMGLAMDLGDETGNLIKNGTEVEWVRENAHLYGFIVRYPKGKEDITGYKYEAWHIRYVGISVATEIYNRNIAFEEY